MCSQELPGRGSDALALGRRGEALAQLLAAKVLLGSAQAVGAAKDAQAIVSGRGAHRRGVLWFPDTRWWGTGISYTLGWWKRGQGRYIHGVFGFWATLGRIWTEKTLDEL